MLSRVARMVAVVALAAAVASGCATEPEPTPTAPTFATEAEAFAAAEETYRAYVEALNRVDLSDPTTFEDVYAWTTGELNATDRKGLSAYYAEGVTVAGESRVLTVEGLLASADLDLVQVAVCLDVSDVEVRDAEGASLDD